MSLFTATAFPAQFVVGPNLTKRLYDNGSLPVAIDGDATANMNKPFTPSAGNLWAAPGVCNFDQVA